VLNRHAIVLFLGSAAILTLVPIPSAAYGLTGISDLVMLVGLLLDVEHPGLRARGARVLQAAGVALALAAAGASASSPPFALAQAGIALAVLGVLAEMLTAYGALRFAVSAQAVGDVLYIVGFAMALVVSARAPSSQGWVFIALAGALSVFAAAYNLQLQIRRLRNLQAGWRFRVVSAAPILRLSTPSGEAQIAWSHVRAVQRLDRRRLLLVLPAPLPQDLARSGLPFDELTRAEAPTVDQKSRPAQYGFVLHEQEIGRALPRAEEEFRRLARAYVTSAEP
jgi:hypothetical protein